MTQVRSEATELDRPVAKAVPLAPGGTPNALVLTGIGLSTACGKPGAWSVKGIPGAYVMCRQETNQGRPIQGLRWIHYGRTTWPGSVVELPEDDLDASVPITKESNYQAVDRSDLMLLLPHQRYTLFWSCDRDHFLDVKAKVAANELPLERVPGAIVFQFTPLVPRNLDGLDLIPWLLEQELLDEHCRDITATCLLNPARGYVLPPAHELKARVANLDVTPEPLRALFRAEFLQWYAQMAAKRSGPHLVALHRACSLIAASETGARDAVMEDLVASQYAKRGSPEYAMFDRYRVYAWKCAAADVRKRAFMDTLPTRLTQVASMPARDGRPAEPADLEWEELARAMRANIQSSPMGPPEHPALGPDIQRARGSKLENLRFKLLLAPGLGLRLVTGYFDLYTLGIRLKKHLIPGRGALLSSLVKEFEAEWATTRNDHVPAVCRTLLAPTSYPDLISALLQHTANEAHRLELYERYLDACAWAEHPWWSGLAAPNSETTTLWMHLAPSVKWLGAALKGTGKTLSGLVEQRLSAYSLSLREAHELLQALFRHEVALSGTTVDPAVHYLERVSYQPGGGPNFRAHVNIQNGQLVVRRDDPLPEAPHTCVTLQLLKRTASEPSGMAAGPARNRHAYQLALEIQKSYSVDLVVPADLAELKRRHTVLPKASQPAPSS